jgi:hypothetical protein
VYTNITPIILKMGEIIFVGKNFVLSLKTTMETPNSPQLNSNSAMVLAYPFSIADVTKPISFNVRNSFFQGWNDCKGRNNLHDNLVVAIRKW